jgi:hypothetical protein
MSTVDITPLISTDRERYLRQNEIRIRTAAMEAMGSGRTDPVLSSTFTALLYCEDFFDRHDVAVTANQAANRQSHADDHRRFVAKAMQLKLRTLDQLCHHIGF